MTVPVITIDLTSIPFTGDAKLILRLKHADKDMIDRAAQRLGMNQAQYLRTVTINSARAIMEK